MNLIQKSIAEVRKYREQYPDCLMLCKVSRTAHMAFDADATIIAEKTGKPVRYMDGVPVIAVSYYDVEMLLMRLVRAGRKVAIISWCK